jgi:hypothetical protein
MLSFSLPGLSNRMKTYYAFTPHTEINGHMLVVRFLGTSYGQKHNLFYKCYFDEFWNNKF